MTEFRATSAAVLERARAAARTSPTTPPLSRIDCGDRPCSPPSPPRERAGVRAALLNTNTPDTLDFAGADGGKNAHYILRWVTPTGRKGPPALDATAPCQGWSETASATIGA